MRASKMVRRCEGWYGPSSLLQELHGAGAPPPDGDSRPVARSQPLLYGSDAEVASLPTFAKETALRVLTDRWFDARNHAAREHAEQELARGLLRAALV